MPSQLIRQDLVPIVIGYLLVMGTLAVGLRMLRRPAPGSRRLASGSGRPVLGSLRRPAPGWPRLIVHLLATAALIAFEDHTLILKRFPLKPG